MELKMKDQIKEHSRRYYEPSSLDEEIIPDEEYDELVRNYDGGVPVGYPPSNIKVKHFIKMLSLENSYNYEDINNWRGKNKINDSAEFSIEHKIDGVACSLVYDNGELVSAATRGDGEYGEDITEQCHYINIPTRIDDECGRLEVRGEIYLPKNKFNSSTHSTARNAAAGFLRLLDMKELKNRGLEFIAYEIADSPNKQSDDLIYLKDIGFDTVESSLTTIDNLITIINDTHKLNLPYDIDGLVIKVNEADARNKLGSTSHHPNYAMAYKFKTKAMATKLIDIKIQVGSKGQITPVGILKPVTINGVKITRVNLCNFNYIAEKDIRINDIVAVERAGEVIPKVVAVLDRLVSLPKYNSPKHCKCGYLIKELNSSFVCDNYNCEERKVARIKYFVSEAGLRINGFGPKLVEDLLERKVIDEVNDIYNLDYERLDTLNSNQILLAIEESKNTTLNKLLTALSINHIGTGAAKLICETFDYDYDRVMNSTRAELIKIKSVGKKQADSFSYWTKNNKDLINELKCIFNFQPKKKTSSNLNILVTGRIEEWTRSQIKEKMEKVGWTWRPTVSNQLDYIVYAENPGAKKVAKAKELGIKEMPLKKFMAKIK